MNGGDLTVNPDRGFVYELDGMRVEIPPCTHSGEHESFYSAVEAIMEILFNEPD